MATLQASDIRTLFRVGRDPIRMEFVNGEDVLVMPRADLETFLLRVTGCQWTFSPNGVACRGPGIETVYEPARAPEPESGA